jgi:ribosomal protein S18 acetylase RimI-like enzyme
MDDNYCLKSLEDRFLMSTLSKLLSHAPSSDRMRRFDARRDLGKVADLVELCFTNTLDPDGVRYLQHMRNAANNPGFLRWASAAADFSGVPLSGYVWEENDRLVGNISLIPYIVRTQRYYLIANVAVHPDFRRRGIARQLTLQAMEYAQLHAANAAWLHVRQENAAAIDLYQSLHFRERARRTTWVSQNGIPTSTFLEGLDIHKHRSPHWKQQRKWLEQLYPPELRWNLPLKIQALNPGIWGRLYRFFTNAYIWQWSALRRQKLLGVISWQATRSYADSLWLAVDPEVEAEVTYALLVHARQHLSPRRPLSLDFPVGHASQAIQAAGFYPQQTLIWMEYRF